MTSGKVYFRQDIVAEPLFNQWYAWSYLLPPASAAMYITNSHLKVMQSFVSAPHVHVAALKNPAMLGGPFINYPPSRVPEIKQLMQKTVNEQAHLLELAEAIKMLDETLITEAEGSSLEGHYSKVPNILKGYIELVYDLHNNPSIRFIEGLLYKSRFYNPESQSVILSQVDGDGRPFAFSTPVLKSARRVSLNVPFCHEGLDELFRMKRVPQPYERTKEMLNIDQEDEEQFSSFFTKEEPTGGAANADEAVRVRYFGHACLLIESKDVSILCDPVISYGTNHGISRYTYGDLPDSIDYVLITHTHQDHIMFETLLQLRHKIKSLIVPKSGGGTLADPSLRLILQTMGFRNVLEIDELESIPINRGVIVSLPFLGEHADLNVRTKAAYFVKIAGTSMLMAADSNNLEPMLYKHLHELLGDIDILFLGMECDGAPMSWLYGPLLTRPLSRKNDQSRRLDGSTYEKAISMVDLLKPKQVYVYAMGQEPWCTFLTSIQYTDQSRPIVESNKLVEDCRSRGLASERLYGSKELLFSSSR